MADAIERIYKLTVDGTQAIRQLENIEKATGGTDSKLATLGNTIKGGLAAFAIKETAGQLVGFLKDTASAMDDLGDSSQKLGIAAQALETFRLAAQFSGSTSENADVAIKQLSKSMAEFDAGSKTTVAAFNKIGVNPQGKAVDEVLNDIADAFSGLPDDANKTALAMELLGKAGAELIPTLNGGASALQDYNQQLRDLGLALTEEDIANAQRLGDAIDTMHKQSEGIARQFLTGLTPALAEIVEGFTKGSVAAEKWNYYGKQTGLFLKALAEAAKGTAQAFVEMGNVGVAAFKSLTTFDLGPVKQAWAQFEAFGEQYQQKVKAIDEEGKRIEEDRTFEKIAKAMSFEGYSDEKPKRAAAAIADTGKAAKGAKDQLTDYEKTLKSLDTEFDSLTARLESWNRVETLLAQVRRDNLKLSDDELTKLQARAAAIDELNRKLEEQAEIEKGFQDAAEKGQQTTTTLQGIADAWKKSLDPMIEYEQKYQQIFDLEQAGMLNADQASAAREKTVKDAEKAMDAFNKKGQETTGVWTDVAKVLDDAIGQGLADILLDSSKSIKDWVSSFLQQMARILLNKAIMGLMSSLFGGTGGVASGIGSVVSGLFSSSAPSAVAMSTSMVPAAVPSADSMMMRAATPMALGAASPSAITTYDVGTLTPAGGGGMQTQASAQGETGAGAVTYITINTDGTSTTTGDDVRLAKKIDSAVKNVIVNEMRPGGLLSGSRS
jgi:lambda family phage tail tape measure protein